jgi:hypothetical protein
LETTLPTHPQIDKRTRAMHGLIVAKIRRDPALFDRVLATLTRWRGMVSGHSQPYLQTWETLAQQGGMEACLSMAVEDSERAAALRQASPFAGLLTNAERFAFLKAWQAKKGDHAATSAP